VDNRLKKLTEIVLSRAQKGFTNKRYIHECIINVVSAIEHCERKRIPAFVLGLDMAKAFDTVRHDYMNLVYKFFGVGNNFIKMLNTISTGRTASIILEEGELSPPFQLGTGFPQGNAPSPNQFNIGDQILIFKIELCNQIESLFSPDPDHAGSPVPIPVPAPVLLPVPAPGNQRTYGANESDRQTNKLEAFANDNTVIAKLKRDAILSIKSILTNFGIISGLKCNVDKSVVC
jgi:hypothetical protein